MDLTTATGLIQHWLPWLTIGGLLWRGYSVLKKNVTLWADTLLDNHAAHMQASLARIEEQGDLQIEILTRIAEK